MPEITTKEKPCFTPGPWQQHGSRIYGPGIQRKLILQVHYSGRGYQEEDAANENILLATPEMYEALKLVCDTYGFDSSTDSAIWKTAFAALAKAEGLNA